MSARADRAIAWRIETPRLVLRPFSADDAPAWRALLDASDAHLRPWIPFMRDEPRSLPGTREVLAEWREAFEAGTSLRYALLDRRGKEILGLGVLLDRSGPGSREVGYLLGVGNGGRGYAREMTRALVQVAFEVHRVERVVAVCDVRNAPSRRIPGALGFVLRGGAAQPGENPMGEPVALETWELRADAYRATPCASLAARAFGPDGEQVL